VHNNFYLLKKLTEELRPRLLSSVLSECYSQTKDELILRFEMGTTSRYIKTNLQPAFSFLSFPETHPRARRNSVDLFSECIGLTVQDIQSFENERSFTIILSAGFQILFKMHANRCNIIVYQNNKVRALFRNNLQADESLSIASLNKLIDWREQAFPTLPGDIKKHYFTFGKLVWEHLTEDGFFESDRATQWKKIQATKSQLEAPTFYLADRQGIPVLSLMALPGAKKQYTSALEALNVFSQVYLQRQSFVKEKANALQQFHQTLAASQHYLEKTKNKLAEVQNDHHFKQWADLLMANLALAKPNLARVTVTDFYTQQPIDIKLKPELSFQKNAEVYYRKAKNQQGELERLQKAIEGKEQALLNTTALVAKIESIHSLKELREALRQLPVAPVIEKTTSLPYHEFVYKGFTIWVGKNANTNDVLTLKFAHKDDLWLHAKDVAGSHVVVKQHPGKPFPKEVIERAAELAAYNSKRKTESLAPVAYTLKKYVRKRKGDPAGTVAVEREDVILVQPKLTTDN
jgi:predicted ribosome quality control (RQC) complex YloA/Tae2 family protein